MARTLDEIIQSLDPGYSGSRDVINQQLTALPQETQAQLSGLQATADQSHQDILDAARRRGLGFSGIPVGEQVKYDATTFKPAVANLYASENNRKLGLTDALSSLYRDQRNQATTLQQDELNREEQQRQFDANLAWQKEQFARQEALQRAANAAASAGSYFGGGGGGSAGLPAASSPGAPAGFRSVLQQAANNGDKNAALALKFVGDDGKYWFDPTKKNTGYSDAVLSALNAVGAKNAYQSPSQPRQVFAGGNAGQTLHWSLQRGLYWA